MDCSLCSGPCHHATDMDQVIEHDDHPCSCQECDEMEDPQFCPGCAKCKPTSLSPAPGPLR